MGIPGRNLPPRRLALPAAALLAAGAAAVAAPALTGGHAHAAASKPASGCVRLHLTEHTLKYLPNEPVGPSGAPDKVGWMAGYLTDLDNFGTDQHVASGTGGLDIISRKSNGHLVQYAAEQVQFPDGTFVGTGAQDQADELAQKWVGMPVKGTGGRFAGMSGTWRWRVLVTQPNHPIEDTITLCRHHS